MRDKWTDGDAYELYVGRWSRKVGELFLQWLDPPSNLHWLDLGCGTGALTAEVLRRCRPRSVIGVEPSEGFLSFARQQVRDASVEFRQGSGERIPLDDRSVEIAISGLVLNFISAKPAAMRELARVVKTGGIVAAYVWDYAGHVQFMRRFWDAAMALNPAARDKDEGVRFPVCRPAPLAELFAASGFADVSVGPIDIATPFRDFDDFWTPFLSGIGPAPGYCMALSDPERLALRQRLKETVPTDPDGMILLAARAWAVRARVP